PYSHWKKPTQLTKCSRERRINVEKSFCRLPHNAPKFDSCLNRTVLIGKAYEYRPVLSRDKAIREELGGPARSRVWRVCRGASHGVKSRQLDAGKLVKVQQLIEEHTQADREGKHE